MFDLTGKIALVTGASSGIGVGIVEALAAQKASVAFGARRKDRLDTLAEKLRQTGATVLPLALDVTDRKNVLDAIATTVAQFGKLDILVNNAGVLDYSPFLEMKEESWDKIIDTNLRGYFYVAQAAAREMAKGKWGRIINIASIASGGVGVGYPMLSHYCASKGGVVGLTEAMAQELGPLGITVNAIGPGAIESEMTANLAEAQKQGMMARLSVKRIGKPADIAAAVVYLVSEEASYTTGATLYVDGGWLAA